MTNSDKADIHALVQTYVDYSNGKRFGQKRTCWDAEEPSPVLSPEEEPFPLVGWQAIDDYWGRSGSVLSSLQSRCWGIHVSLLNERYALALYNLFWRADVNGPFLGGAPLGAHVRVTAMLRRKKAGWRIFASIESHVDGDCFVRKLYHDGHSGSTQ